MEHKIISADDHVQEPRDCYLTRVPARLRDRAPQIVSTDEGDFWVVDGVKSAKSFGLEAQAGNKFEDYKDHGGSYKSIRTGTFEPTQRLKDMDTDGLRASVLFPNLGMRLFADLRDLELQAVVMRAYNDFLSEFCGTDPNRLIGVAMIPTGDNAASIAEIERVAKLGGLRGIMLPMIPKNVPLNHDDFDPVWAAAQDAGLPVHLHLAAGGRGLPADYVPDPKVRGSHMVLLAINVMGNIEAISQIIHSGAMERFPRLKVVSVESAIGWIPFYLERWDRNYKRHRYWTQLNLPNPPSVYFKRQVYATFIEDRVGILNRDLIGVDRVMWSSDYPHTDTTWPNSLKYIDEHFAGVPEADKHKMIYENAARLYGLA